MSNSPSIDRIVISLRVPRALHKRLVKLTLVKKESLSDTVNHLLSDAVAHIVLTPDDCAQIAKDTEEARRRKQK